MLLPRLQAPTGIPLLSLLLLIVFIAGCRDSGPAADSPAAGGAHHHDPPHGGTAITLGDEDFHVEFVLDADAGKMTAYILAAHMSGFVRVPQTSFEVTARLSGLEETLVFQAVATPATGETVGDTSQFEARADWLKGRPVFDAVLKEITLKGSKYSNVAFKFP